MEDSNDSVSVRKSKLPLYISIGILGLGVLSYLFVPGVKEFLEEAWTALSSGDDKMTEQWVSQFGIWGPVVIVLAMVVQMFLIVIPTPVLMLVTILAYGPWWGSLIIFAAIFVASSVGYYIGRYFGPVIVDKIIGQKAENKITSFIEEYGFWTVIVVRLSPFLSNDAISFVGGILEMGYWKFIGATLLGIAPLIGFIAYLEGDWERMKSGLIWASVICLVLFIGFVWWDKRRN